MLDAIVHDEARHAAYGWRLLDWFLQGPTADDTREAMITRLPAIIDGVELAYASVLPVADPWEDSDDPEAFARSWGVVPPTSYWPVVDRTLHDVVLPRLTARGVQRS